MLRGHQYADLLLDLGEGLSLGVRWDDLDCVEFIMREGHSLVDLAVGTPSDQLLQLQSLVLGMFYLTSHRIIN